MSGEHDFAGRDRESSDPAESSELNGAELGKDDHGFVEQAPGERADDLGEAVNEIFDAELIENDSELKSGDGASVLAQRDEYLESLLRLQAEFDNYRKRMVRQQTDLLERSTESLLAKLLPVLDAVDLALVHANGEDENKSADPGAFGQIASLLRDILAKEGLERIEDVGVVFDPTIHDAVAHVSASEQDQDQDGHDGATEHSKGHEARVAEVLRAGYRLKGRVLRPAMVKVEG